MNSEKLLDAIGEVKDAFLLDAEREAARKKNTWVKWAAAAACLCLVAGGAFALRRSGGGGAPLSGDLPQITVPALENGGMGFEALMYYSAEELENGNPWREDLGLSTLPVYKNGSWDPSGAGVPLGLSEGEMAERLDREAEALGLTILEIQRETNEEKGKDGTALPGDTVYRLRAQTDRGALSALANGTVIYNLPKGSALPEEYHFTYTETSRAEAEAVMEYLTGEYASFLAFDRPEIVLQGEYTFSGEYTRSYLVYDAAADDTERILNYWFRSARFAPDDEGNLMLISRYDGLSSAEKLGDYPLISPAEATEKLLGGQYQTSVPASPPVAERIARAELVYRSGPREETLLPYYRFYVELREVDGVQMTRENGLKTYGAYYVPAIQEEYIANWSTYGGWFN